MRRLALLPMSCNVGHRVRRLVNVQLSRKVWIYTADKILIPAVSLLQDHVRGSVYAAMQYPLGVAHQPPRKLKA